jgi:hypothetical protein
MKPALRPHFGITVGGVSLAYCYIRKNACSAWKRLIIGESPVLFSRSDWKNEFAFMSAHHGLRTTEEIDRSDRRIVVVRDPVDRFVSAFISLFVTRTPPPTRRLRALGDELFGRDIFDMSFDMLLDCQLPAPDRRRRGLDKHLWPQVWHLAPTTYTDVIDIGFLGAEMNRLIGTKLGTQYFDKAVNATSAIGTYDDGDAPSLSARAFVERFGSTGLLPSKASFLHGGRGDAVRKAYDEDASLYEACRAHHQAHPGTSMELRIGANPRRRRRNKGNGGRNAKPAGGSHRRQRS